MIRLLAVMGIALSGCAAPRVASLKPVLTWPEFPSKQQVEADPRLKGIRVAYEVMLVRMPHGRGVIEKRGITVNRLPLEAALEPDVEYSLNVRPRFELGGSPRLGEWTQQKFRTPAPQRLVPGRSDP